MNKYGYERIDRTVGTENNRTFSDARSQLDKGNKTAGLRARRTSLEMEPLLKQFRKMSLEIANEKRKD